MLPGESTLYRGVDSKTLEVPPIVIMGLKVACMRRRNNYRAFLSAVL